MTGTNVFKAGISLSERLEERGAISYLGILPEIDSEGKTGADDFIVLRGTELFDQWIESLQPFVDADLYLLGLLLNDIPNDIPKEEIPFKLEPLIKELLKLAHGVGEQYIGSKVKEYFNLKAKEVNNLINLLKDRRKKTRNLEGEIRCHIENNYGVDSDGYFYYMKNNGDHQVPVRLININPRIEKEIIEDNGVETKISYIIAGDKMGEELPKIEVPASSFPAMNWIHNWGVRIILQPGSSTKDYLRHGIQVKSHPVTETNYTHLGWREKAGAWIYLTASGAIGDENVRVKLSREEERYLLPLKPDNEIQAIRLSLSFLEIGKKSVTYPLLSFAYLAPLTSLLSKTPNFTLYIYGETGTFKTTIAVLVLCHFGNFEADRLSNFEDTANSLEKKAFILKDTIMIADDYHPSNRMSDAYQKESIAQRLIRSFSNRTGRGRLNADTSDKGRYEPRGLLIITGEELPSIQSTIGRVAVTELNCGDIDTSQLSRLQQQSDLLPHAMSSYIYWLMDNMNDIKNRFSEEFPKLRQSAIESERFHHPKLSEQVAFLQFSIDTFLRFAMGKGVIEECNANDMRAKALEIFMTNAESTDKRIKSEDPVIRFLEIISTLLLQEKIKFRIKDSVAQTMPCSLVGDEYSELVGYIDDEFVYFIPTAIWSVIQKYSRSEGTHFPVKKNTFYRLLRERGIIVARGTENTTTERICGESIRVLKAYRDKIIPNEDKTTST